MFTIKYRTYQLAPAQQSGGPLNYDRCEQIHGPFTLISQEADEGYLVVYAHNGDDSGIAFGPIKEDVVAGKPRPKLWVMNEAGTTVAAYDL